MSGDEKLITYLQRVSGYALTGLTGEQIWVFVYGPTATGKSNYLETKRGIIIASI
jgi:phage/plasmid-associated DNA primase